jgi:hypothetical protein
MPQMRRTGGDCEHRVGGNITIARSFLRLATLVGGAFERLNRYETAVWRQVGQFLIALDMLQRR